MEPLQDQNKYAESGLAERSLKELEEKYVVVGRMRIRPWHAWLIFGLIVGLVAGIAWVSNRNLEQEQSRAAEFGLPQLPPAPGPPKAPPSFFP